MEKEKVQIVPGVNSLVTEIRVPPVVLQNEQHRILPPLNVIGLSIRDGTERNPIGMSIGTERNVGERCLEVPNNDGHNDASPLTQTSNSPQVHKKYLCKVCNQGFSRKHNMVSHELIHLSQKPHVCTVCNLRFRRIHDLKRHEKLHTGEKPFVCERCYRRFARPDALTRHISSQNACFLQKAFVKPQGDIQSTSQQFVSISTYKDLMGYTNTLQENLTRMNDRIQFLEDDAFEKKRENQTYPNGISTQLSSGQYIVQQVPLIGRIGLIKKEEGSEKNYVNGYSSVSLWSRR